MTPMTLQQLYAYHSMDRELFFLMISPLQRDLAQSLLVIAFWLWLEETGYPNLIEKLLNSTCSLINKVADEAVSCLKFLESYCPPAADDESLVRTAAVLTKKINLQMFYHRRYTTITGIRRILNSVCTNIFSDIILTKMVEKGLRLADIEINQPVGVTGFPHPLFGAVSVVPRTMDYVFPTRAIREVWGSRPEYHVPEDDRTMFLTFSRGFAVRESEVRELFTRMFGDCIENLYMQEKTQNREQALFARLVLRYITTVDQILDGRRISKFRINGKHIWARKYERRD